MICKICSQPSAPLERAVLLQKHPVQYYKCSKCQFIQTEEPYWLDEAYASPITQSDIGLVGRNIGWTKPVQAIIGTMFNAQGKFLDYGGGYGLFVRLMRDAGFDFYLYDKHCVNLFARGFEALAQSEPTYELVTAFEVFEHLVQPREEIGKMLQFSRNILFSTTLVPAHTPKLTDWWYYGLDHGQHVALYSRRSMLELAHYFDLNLISTGHQLHLLTDKRLSNLAFSLLSYYRIAIWVARLTKQPSLLAPDYIRITGKPFKQ